MMFHGRTSSSHDGNGPCRSVRSSINKSEKRLAEHRPPLAGFDRRRKVQSDCLIESLQNLHGWEGVHGRGSMNQEVSVPIAEGSSATSEEGRARLARMFVDYHAMVWRMLRRRGLTPDAAADATQEAFLIASGRLANIPPDSERAFLIATALRVAHTLGRKTVRWQLDEDMDQRVANARDAGEAQADLQLCDLALSKVNPELAEVFALYEIEGLSSPEIAALLEIPLGSVASRLRRAREQFRAAAAKIELSLRRGGR